MSDLSRAESGENKAAEQAPRAVTGRAALRETVRCDLARHYGYHALPSVWRAALFKKTFTPVLTLRLFQHHAGRRGLASRLARPFLRLAHRWACGRLSIELPLATKIGPGLRIIHGFGLVVNAQAEIGAEVTLFHGVTIGQRDAVRDDGRTTRHSRIGNRVTLFPYAQIAGAEIGEGASVAPLTVVHKEVAPGVVVGGNPMQILKKEAVANVRYGTVHTDALRPEKPREGRSESAEAPVGPAVAAERLQ